ncbi:guanine deaminase [Hesseltinella vesiculosa]|uniref:Guanine deaminase n=1 Tax=Hesseltinella vesiculosa TaxID=101127 RepID=A0A1X2GII6_9FUNG|nr:guanine deaminase [Hesseltinella vesiculosa]
MVETSHIYYGTIVHTLSVKNLEIIQQAVLVVSNGIIVKLDRNVKDIDAYISSASCTNYVLHRLGEHEFLIPGLVDTHAHAPQYVFAGSGMDLPLMDWLNTYTFPSESKFKDEQYAQDAYAKTVHRFLRNGTTTCSWFATIHLAACKRLVDTIHDLGQRAYVGKVNMDQNSPDYYVEASTQASLDDTRLFIDYTKAKAGHDRLITPVVTPRFAVSCSTPLMRGLADLAKEYRLPIQSHLCENPDEIKFACSLFPDCKNYTDIYQQHGLLGPDTYMAHCVHMTDDEINLLATTQTGVAHCANSNFSLQSGVCDVQRLLSHGIKVGLGTDVAGGFSPSILDAIRSGFWASKMKKVIERDMHGNSDYVCLQPSELLFLATLGGAQVLGLQDLIGNFVEGKAFDALWIDADRGNVDLIGDLTIFQKLEKFLFNGSADNILHVYVQGRRVSGVPDDENDLASSGDTLNHGVALDHTTKPSI